MQIYRYYFEYQNSRFFNSLHCECPVLFVNNRLSNGSKTMVGKNANRKFEKPPKNAKNDVPITFFPTVVPCCCKKILINSTDLCCCLRVRLSNNRSCDHYVTFDNTRHTCQTYSVSSFYPEIIGITEKRNVIIRYNRLNSNSCNTH